MRPSSVARAARSSPKLCTACGFVPLGPRRTAKTAFSTQPIITSRPLLASRFDALESTRSRYGCQIRLQSSEAAPGAADWPSKPQQPATEVTPTTSSSDLPDLIKLSNLVQKSKERFLSTDGIPAPQLVLAALRTCQGAANAIHPYLSQTTSRANSTASTASSLLSLDPASSKTGNPHASSSPHASTLLREAVETISDSAYAILAHAPVEITPEVLHLYVNIQARLGMPETLPHALELYASKPKPRVVDGAIDYVPQKAARADKAIEPKTAEAALRTAIEARHLDASLGIIESCYTTSAFVRQKLLKKAFLPVTVMGATPFAVYAISATLSTFQNTIEPATATKCAFAGIIAYLFFTSSIGTIAKVTTSDHMKRVTWAPGMPLHQRWVREEERAALDEVACAWGYKEKWRHGEEGGTEWESLREYLGLKGMILDRVEFMEGMN